MVELTIHLLLIAEVKTTRSYNSRSPIRFYDVDRIETLLLQALHFELQIEK
jgi:hypothetical protein